jgi:hypothetical protein
MKSERPPVDRGSLWGTEERLILELLDPAESRAQGAIRMLPCSSRGSGVHRRVVLGVIERKLLEAAGLLSKARDLVGW